MLWAAGLEAPRAVFGHGFVNIKGEKISKTLGNVVDPMDIITKFNAEAFRYYFLRECPFPSDGEFGWARFVEVYNSELANNLGNLYSRVITLVSKNFGGVLPGGGIDFSALEEAVGGVVETWGTEAALFFGDERKKVVEEIRQLVESCRYNQALQLIWQSFLVPANRFVERSAPWKLVKQDLHRAAEVLKMMVLPLRIVPILLKPFIPKSAEAVYTSFNFPKPWAEVTYADAAELMAQPEDLRITAELIDDKVKPLFPAIR